MEIVTFVKKNILTHIVIYTFTYQKSLYKDNIKTQCYIKILKISISFSIDI